MLSPNGLALCREWAYRLARRRILSGLPARRVIRGKDIVADD